MIIPNAVNINFSAFEHEIKNDLLSAFTPLPFYMNLFPRFPKWPEVINTFGPSLCMVFGSGSHLSRKKKEFLKEAYNGGAYRTESQFPESYFDQAITPLERVASAVHEVAHFVDLAQSLTINVAKKMNFERQAVQMRPFLIANISERIADASVTFYLLSNVSDQSQAEGLIQKRKDDRSVCLDKTHYTVDSIERAVNQFHGRPIQGLRVNDAITYAQQVVLSQASELGDQFAAVFKASNCVTQAKTPDSEDLPVAALLRTAISARKRLLALT